MCECAEGYRIDDKNATCVGGKITSIISTSLASCVCGTSGKLLGLFHLKITIQTVMRLVTTTEAAGEQSCEQRRGLIRRRARF